MKNHQLNHFYGRVDMWPLMAANKGKLPNEIELMRVGHFIMNTGEEVDVTHADLDRFVESFNSGIVGKGEDNSDLSLPINFSHRDEGEAAGWISEIYHNGDGVLRAKTDWTDVGETALTNKRFKYISPEWYFFYRDKETQRERSNVIVGAGLTNIPLFKKLAPLTSHDTGAILYSKSSKNSHKSNTKQEAKAMKVREIITKDVKELSEKEIAHLKKHVAKLDDEAKKKFASVLETKAPEKKPTKKEEASTKGNDSVDMVQFKAMEKRLGELETEKKEANAKEAINKFVASDTNTEGTLLAKHVDSAVEIYKTMDKENGEKFLAFIESLPNLGETFKNKGSEENDEGDSAANKLVAAAKKIQADKEVGFSEALKLAKVENQDLVKGYNKEYKQEA